MTEDIQPEVLKRTQESLGKFIKKPVLSEKLLRKPPFRFLHDICTAAMKETGFLEDILSGNDVKIELINDKEGKIAFLQKVIAAVETANNVKLTVKPTKIVAGHEPIKTNEFLQALAHALEKQVQARPSKKTEKKNKTVTSDVKNEDFVKKSKVVKPEVKHEDAVKKKNKVNTKTTEVRKKKPVEKKVEKEVQEIKPVEKKVEKEVQEIRPKEKPEEVKPVEEIVPEPVKEPHVNGVNAEAVPENGIENAKTVEPALRPASAKFKRRTPSAHREANTVESVLGDLVTDGLETATPDVIPVKEDETSLADKDKEQKDAIVTPVPATPGPPRPRTAIRPPSARPASARPAAPRIRDRGQVPLQEEVIKPAVGKVNLISDQDAAQDDEELVSVQTVQDVVSEPEVVNLPDGAEHGQLVNQILEAQRELEEDAFAKKAARTEIEWSTGRGIEGTRKEVERLRTAVQTLTRSANPLGKLLEYLQEDVDSMQQELSSWRERNTSLSAKLEQERSLTDKSIEPLKAHLEELEQSIQQEWEQIGAVKANVLRNDERINRLFTGL